MITVKLHFYGYTWEDFRWQIVHYNGIFIVYRGILDAEGFPEMKEILYIGNTSMTDLYNMPIMNDMKQYLSGTDKLFFSFAEVDKSLAGEIEEVLIDRVKPRFNKPINTSLSMTIESSGNCELLPNLIIANNE